jgi:hypothetical protein
MGRVLRRSFGGLLVAALLLTAFAFYTYSPYLSLTAAPDGLATTAAPSASAPPDPSTASPAPSSTAVPSPTAGAPDRDLPPGPGGQEPGIRLVATVRPSGVFEVIETVRLAAPVSRVTLSPPNLRAASRTLQSTHPFAAEVVVRADEQQSVRPPRSRVQRATTLALSQPTDRFEIRYVLRGSVRYNKPSSAGRALGAVAPLTSRLPDDFPVAITVRGRAVRNLGCVRLSVDQWACMAGERPNARVNRSLPFRAALVQVQLDLQAGR